MGKWTDNRALAHISGDVGQSERGRFRTSVTALERRSRVRGSVVGSFSHVLLLNNRKPL